MPIRIPLVALAVCAALLAWPAHAEPGTSGYAPLRPVSACLDPGRVRSWQLLLDNRVLVDAGRQHYVIEVRGACPELGYNPFLGFFSNNPIGRICGEAGDRLIPHGSAASGRPNCAIQRMQAISRDEYARIAQQRRLDGTVDTSL